MNENYWFMARYTSWIQGNNSEINSLKFHTTESEFVLLHLQNLCVGNGRQHDQLGMSLNSLPYCSVLPNSWHNLPRAQTQGNVLNLKTFSQEGYYFIFILFLQKILMRTMLLQKFFWKSFCVLTDRLKIKNFQSWGFQQNQKSCQ